MVGYLNANGVDQTSAAVKADPAAGPSGSMAQQWIYTAGAPVKLSIAGVEDRRNRQQLCPNIAHVHFRALGWTMITFERSQDYELIRRIMTHPRVFPHISDDSSPAAEEFRPVESDVFWYVILRDVKPVDQVDTLGALDVFSGKLGVLASAYVPLTRRVGAARPRSGEALKDWIWDAYAMPADYQRPYRKPTSSRCGSRLKPA